MIGLASHQERWRAQVAAAGVFLLTLAMQLLVISYEGYPAPYINDEFAYLLAADTFAHGRITNPPHPLWKFFETVHILSQPTYMMKYPPGQGLVLALGQVVFGHPLWGVVLSVAFFTAALTWSIFPITSLRVAILAGIFAIIQFGIGHYWVRSYWGGALPALASALLLGAYIRSYQQKRLAALPAVITGAVLLWFTRPFDGGLFIISLLMLVAYDLRHNHMFLNKTDIRKLVLLVVTGIGIISLQGYYNVAITGDVFKTPGLLHLKQYNYSPEFWFMPAHAPAGSDNPSVNDAHKIVECEEYRQIQDGTPEKQLFFILFKLFFVFSTVPLIVLIVLTGAFFKKTPLLSRLYFCLLVTFTGFFVLSWSQPHYLFGFVVLGYSIAFYQLQRLAFHRFFPKPVIYSAAFFLMFMHIALIGATGPLMSGKTDLTAFQLQQNIHSLLQNKHRKALVLVTYAGDPYYEWVHNLAPIDDQPILWAHDRGAHENQKIMDYYPDRDIWRVETACCPTAESALQLVRERERQE